MQLKKKTIAGYFSALRLINHKASVLFKRSANPLVSQNRTTSESVRYNIGFSRTKSESDKSTTESDRTKTESDRTKTQSGRYNIGFSRTKTESDRSTSETGIIKQIFRFRVNFTSNHYRNTNSL